MAVPHALVLPLPYQGHVIPLMTLSHCLVDLGFRITFVNTELNHKRVAGATATNTDTPQIRLVSVGDGLGEDDYCDIVRLMRGLEKRLASFLEELVSRSGDEAGGMGGGEKITCLIYDGAVASVALPVAKKMGIRSCMFSPVSALVTLANLRVNKLIEDGIVDSDGVPATQEKFQLAPGLPFINAAHLLWNCIGDEQTQKNVFHFIFEQSRAAMDMPPDFILSNSCRDIEAPVFAHAPFIHPVGPLISVPPPGGDDGGRRRQQLAANFWSEDESCITWLEAQEHPNSVLYVAFGSTKKFSRRQFEELALGLEITGRPFLFVVRPDCYDGDDHMNAFLDGFRSRVESRGRVVEWAPQQKVLGHRAVACFINHCGWNSTTEGVMAGTPFLCWPYSADNFMSESYICDVWRTGLRLEPDEEEVVERKQIKMKVEELLGDEEMRLRADQLKEIAMGSVKEGGTSFQTIKNIAEALKKSA